MTATTDFNSECPHEWSVSVDVQDASRGNKLLMQMRIESVVCKKCGSRLGHRFAEDPRPDDVLPLYPMGQIDGSAVPSKPVAETLRTPRVGVPYRPSETNSIPPSHHPANQPVTHGPNPFAMGKHQPNKAVPNIFGSCQN